MGFSVSAFINMMEPPMITITRYGRKFWAVYWQGDLLCVTVYKRGALVVKAALEA